MNTKLGYSVHPNEQIGSEWDWQFDVNLYQQPTYKHFDPERMDIWMVERSGDVARITVSHPWHRHKQLNLCAGRIILHDRKDKAVEVYSFGGELSILVGNSSTTCHITSPAPIIELIDSNDTPTRFICEVEAALACLKAEWGVNEAGFMRKLAAIEPCLLFAAATTAVQQKLSGLPATQAQKRLRYFLDQAINAMQAAGKWPAATPNLAVLLETNPVRP